MDHYDNISVMSTYWKSDDTGGDLDSSLFIETIRKLTNEETSVETQVHVLEDGDRNLPLLSATVLQAESMTGTRNLFILHYAGHAIASSTADNLLITARISEDTDGQHINMTLIRDALKSSASTCKGLDILLVLDCCCSAIAGQGRWSLGERVELMAATSPSGISNSRKAGQTFTQHWCQALDKFLRLGQPFDCNQIKEEVNTNRDLEQYPAVFVLREGWGVPITFRALPSSITSPTGSNTQIIIAAFLLEENPDAIAFNRLVRYLERTPEGINITILAALPLSSTLLLLRMPAYLQEMLGVPRISLIFGHRNV